MKQNNENSCVIISVGREELTLGPTEIDLNNESEGKNKARGFHLSRSKWDPYPWVGSVEKNSIAHISGLRAGDCLLKVDSTDLLGLRMQDIATLIGRENEVNLQIWRRPRDEFFNSIGDEKTIANYDTPLDIEIDDKKEKENVTAVALQGPLPEVAYKLANAVSGVVKTLECPVCLESSAPPVSQCVHGHILCVGCRPKTERCPVCRVRLGQGRCLLADKFHRVLQDSFSISSPSTSKVQNYSLHEKLFGSKKSKDKNMCKAADTKSIQPKSKHLLSKLFLSSKNDARASSTESLPGATTKSFSNGREFLLRKTFGEHLDRAKSASTGELTGDNRNSLIESVRSNDTARSSSFLNVPQTPIWGGSTESMTDFRFPCPISKSICTEKVTCGTVLEHLVNFHKGPFIHFYGGAAKLSYPLPFGEDGIYVVHCFEDLFFLQNEKFRFWVNGVISSGKKWEWSIEGYGNFETIHFVKEVLNVQESDATLEENTIVLPSLSFDKLHIVLSELKLGERFKI